MILKFFLMQVCVFFFLFPSLIWGADKIQGSACYTYGDSESLVQAEQTAKTLAIRNAIESYSVFIESTTQVTDLQLSSDLINTVSAGQVKGLNVLKRLQSGRKLCYTVEGYVEPTDIRKTIGDYLKGKSQDVQLQDNGYLRILKEPSIVRFYFIPNVRLIETMLLETDNESFTEEQLREKNISKDDKRYMRCLYASVQFLKPCIASTVPSKDEVFMAFKCDYRFKIFVTFYSEQGTEIETTGQYVFNTYQDNDKGNVEKSPGENGVVLFVIPQNAKTWKIWVPK